MHEVRTVPCSQRSTVSRPVAAPRARDEDSFVEGKCSFPGSQSVDARLRRCQLLRHEKHSFIRTPQQRDPERDWLHSDGKRGRNRKQRYEDTE